MRKRMNFRPVLEPNAVGLMTRDGLGKETFVGWTRPAPLIWPDRWERTIWIAKKSETLTITGETLDMLKQIRLPKYLRQMLWETSKPPTEVKNGTND